MTKQSHSDIKQYEEIKKLTTGEHENYTTGCLLGYKCIENHYKLIAINLIRKKKYTLNQNQINKQNSLYS